MVSAVNFLTGVLLARSLGIAQFGVFQVIWMAILLLGNLQLAMIVQPLMSIAPKKSEAEMPPYLGAALFQQLLFAGASAALLFAGAHFFGALASGWQARSLATPLAAATFAVQTQDFLRRYFFTRGRPAVAFANDGISYLGQLAVLAGLFFAGAMSMASAVWVIAGSSAAAVFVGFAAMERLAWDRTVARSVGWQHFHFSKWLAGSALIQAGAVYSFVVTAAWTLGAAAAGAMKAAQNLVGVLHVLFMGLENVVPVEASRKLRHGGRASISAYLLKISWVGGLASGSFALVVAARPDLWLRLIYGTDYAAYGQVLRWYAAIYVVAFFGTPLRAWLRAHENTRPIFWATVGMLVVTAATAVPLSTQWGLTGTMAGMLGAYLVLQGMLVAAVWSRRPGVAGNLP